jgi:hypothetical protein
MVVREGAGGAPHSSGDAPAPVGHGDAAREAEQQRACQCRTRTPVLPTRHCIGLGLLDLSGRCASQIGPPEIPCGSRKCHLRVPPRDQCGRDALLIRWRGCRSSPAMCGAPQSGLAADTLRMRSRISRGIAGRPGFPDPLSFLQYSRSFRRRQARTVSGLTITKASRQPDQIRESQAQRIRSAGRSLGRADARW